VKFLTEPGDLVVDIFGGSKMTGLVAEQHGRRWKCCELDAGYLKASVMRFPADVVTVTDAGSPLSHHPRVDLDPICGRFDRPTLVEHALHDPPTPRGRRCTTSTWYDHGS